MGLHDRPYWKDDAATGGGGGLMRGMSIGLPKPGKTVKWLLIINLAAFVAQQVFLLGFKLDIAEWLGATAGGYWQVWRYLTFQFLHAPDGVMHIALNMLGLYMFGTALEQLWGTRQFLRFYLSCGVMAGVLYVIFGLLLGNPRWIPLIGASGGVFGILLACAVLFPHFKIILLFFPVPIRLAAIIIFGGMVLYILSRLRSESYDSGFWSQVAHFGGTAMAATWLWVIPRFMGAARGAARKTSKGAWERKMRRQRDEQSEINRILDKIRTDGLDSLTRKEKRTLKDATRRQQKDERDISQL